MTNDIQIPNQIKELVIEWPTSGNEKRIKMMQCSTRILETGEQGMEVLGDLCSIASEELKESVVLLNSIFASLGKVELRSTENVDVDAKQDYILLAYKHLGKENPARFGLLGMLPSMKSEECLELFAELILVDPPQDESQLMACFGPFFRTQEFDSSAIFPKLFDGLGDLNLAGPVLDLANYIYRFEIAEVHPAVDQLPRLRRLFSSLLSQLEVLEKNGGKTGEEAQKIAKSVAFSTSLLVSLSDTFGLTEDELAIPMLQHAFLLSHRRLKAESSFALARMGDEEGAGQLIKLAEDPASRIRVLRYCEELEILDDVDPDWQTDQAMAEARLATWLAEPAQMGIAPTRLELFDRRFLQWPGFEEPVDCFLFRFWYSFGRGEYTNVGISGPLTFAIQGDLADLPADMIYAAFAGWHAQHEEIEEYDARALSVHYQPEIDRLKRSMSDNGYREPAAMIYGKFFGATVLVAQAVYEGAEGIAVTDRDEFLWFPNRGQANPISPQEAYCVYKGKMLLRNFNTDI